MCGLLLVGRCLSVLIVGCLLLAVGCVLLFVVFWWLFGVGVYCLLRAMRCFVFVTHCLLRDV